MKNEHTGSRTSCSFFFLAFRSLFSCFVSISRSPFALFFLILKIDGPKEVTILDADSVILRDGSEAGPYNEGGHLVLVCETEATEPPVNLYWYRNNELIDTSFEETEQRIIRNELTVLRLTREHLQNRFTCKATNSNLTVSKEATVILELNCKYRTPKLESFLLPCFISIS